MRNIAILCLLLACALPALAGTYRADEIPNVQRMDRRRYVSDPDGILSPAAVAHIDSVCASLRERGLAQVAVVAVDDIAGGDTFSFAVDLFRSWGVGSAKSNNGLGILLVKDLREIRFVTGGGLEGILPDALCKRIQLNYMLPAFREGLDIARIRDYAEEKKSALVLPDQDILTAVCGEHVRLLDPLRYNLSDRILAFHNADLRSPQLDADWVRRNGVIVHYCGKNKPWHENYRGVLDVFYREIAAEKE